MSVAFKCSAPPDIYGYSFHPNNGRFKVSPAEMSVNNNVTDNFTTLLRLNLIDGFRLTIRMAVGFERTIHTNNLLAMNQRVKAVSKTFSEKNAKVNIEFEFKFHSQYRIGDRFQHWWSAAITY
jgi:hypothetical protein